MHYWLLLLMISSACSPPKTVIPKDIEAIAHDCYATITTPERTPKLTPSQAMEDGTVMIRWSMTQFPNERGSCIVDSSGTVIVVTSNADEQQQPEETSADEQQTEETSTEKSTSQE